jgi:hypothetical protein
MLVGIALIIVAVSVPIAADVWTDSEYLEYDKTPTCSPADSYTSDPKARFICRFVSMPAARTLAVAFHAMTCQKPARPTCGWDPRCTS